MNKVEEQENEKRKQIGKRTRLNGKQFQYKNDENDCFEYTI